MSEKLIEAGTTEIKGMVEIDEIKGSCPRCGGPLILKEYVGAWNPDGTPSEDDTFKTPYCPSCKVFWLAGEE